MRRDHVSQPPTTVRGRAASRVPKIGFGIPLIRGPARRAAGGPGRPARGAPRPPGPASGDDLKRDRARDADRSAECDREFPEYSRYVCGRGSFRRPRRPPGCPGVRSTRPLVPAAPGMGARRSAAVSDSIATIRTMK